MWRLNVRSRYLETVIRVKKFFLDERYDFKTNEELLLQVVKQDQPGRVLGRIRGLLFFERLVKDASDESVMLYGLKWKYAITCSRVVRLPPREWFNLEDLIGYDAAKKYYGQTEAVKLAKVDERAVRNKIGEYLPLHWT